MNEENKKYGYIGLWRSLLSWEWFQEPNTLSVFIYCLLSANSKDGNWKGHEVKRGSFITSLAKISKDTGLSMRQTRTALEHLEMTGEVTKCSTSKFTVISVKNYNFYQVSDKQNDRVPTKNRHNTRQTSDKLSTTNKNNKRDILPKGNISLGKKEKNSPDVAVPGGTPQANKKPSYREMREYYEQITGRDDAVLVDDFDRECRNANDYSNWQKRLLEFRR